MLEFYFLFRFLRLHHHLHVILHLPTKFRSNRTIRDREHDVISIFQDGGLGGSELEEPLQRNKN